MAKKLANIFVLILILAIPILNAVDVVTKEDGTADTGTVDATDTGTDITDVTGTDGTGTGDATDDTKIEENDIEKVTEEIDNVETIEETATTDEQKTEETVTTDDVIKEEEEVKTEEVDTVVDTTEDETTTDVETEENAVIETTTTEIETETLAENVTGDDTKTESKEEVTVETTTTETEGENLAGSVVDAAVEKVKKPPPGPRYYKEPEFEGTGSKEECESCFDANQASMYYDLVSQDCEHYVQGTEPEEYWITFKGGCDVASIFDCETCIKNEEYYWNLKKDVCCIRIPSNGKIQSAQHIFHGDICPISGSSEFSIVLIMVFTLLSFF